MFLNHDHICNKNPVTYFVSPGLLPTIINAFNTKHHRSTIPTALHPPTARELPGSPNRVRVEGLEPPRALPTRT